MKTPTELIASIKVINEVNGKEQVEMILSLMERDCATVWYVTENNCNSVAQSILQNLGYTLKPYYSSALKVKAIEISCLPLNKETPWWKFW